MLLIEVKLLSLFIWQTLHIPEGGRCFGAVKC